MLLQISSPVLPILDEVVLVPITGELAPERMERLMRDVLTGMETHGARLAILDITGVPSVDQSIADVLLRMVDAIRLLGAECVLVGISPDVAHAMISLGISLSEITSKRDLQSGIEYAMAQSGRQIVAAQRG